VTTTRQRVGALPADLFQLFSQHLLFVNLLSQGLFVCSPVVSGGFDKLLSSALLSNKDSL
jgi:hypothetical protein